MANCREQTACICKPAGALADGMSSVHDQLLYDIGSTRGCACHSMHACEMVSVLCRVLGDSPCSV
eukprot:649306-Amphidinium_carterae.1